MKVEDYYDNLGIERSASDTEVKNAYRRLAQRFHPDVTDDPDGERKFKEVSAAYKTLKCTETRTAYDRWLRSRRDESEADQPSEPFNAWYLLFQWPMWPWIWPK